MPPPCGQHNVNYEGHHLLIEDIQQSPFEGIGQPEALKHNLSEYWSRRITEEHHIVYKQFEH
ncbi:MAG: Txe/YoeB family addiction module toxin [Verrucomicrobiota bacterium]